MAVLRVTDTHRRKTPAKPAAPEPAQPLWRQPPPKPRGEMVRLQTAVKGLDHGAAGKNAKKPAWFSGRLTWRVAGAALIVLLLALSLAQVWFHAAFRVSAVAVYGVERVLAEDVGRASGVEGRSIFQIRPAAAERSITALPGVTAATVHVRLPNQVIVDVVEHQPWVAWQVITETVWLAADGRTRVPVAGAPPALSLVDETGAAMDEAGRMKPYVYSSLRALHLARPEMTAVYYGRLEGLYYRAPEGWTIYLGDQGKVAAKLALLQAVQNSPAVRNTRPEVIDLRYEGRAEIR